MFASKDDADDAVKLVDGSEMKNMRGSCVVRVDADRPPERDTRRRSRSRCAACDRSFHCDTTRLIDIFDGQIWCRSY